MVVIEQERQFGDFVQPFQIEDLGIRGRLIRINDTFRSAVDAHAYPTALRALLGETMVLTATLASALKYDGVFTLQAQGDGPVPLVMADMMSDGTMRAYAKIKEDADLSGMENASIPMIVGAGHLAFTVDQGPDTDRYQGITALEGATLTDCAQSYFRQSEQLETVLVIVSDAHDDDYRAAGLMLQRLPADKNIEEEDEKWRRAVVLMSSITSKELLDRNLNAADILYRLYHQDGVRLYDQDQLRHQCRCSGERVQQTLLSFPRDEITDMADDGMIIVTCEFCLTDYTFEIDRLDELQKEERTP